MRCQPIFKLILSGYLVMVLSACASHQTTKADAAEPIQPIIAWPPAPAQARITYESSWHEAADFGIKKGFWKRLFEFVVGPSYSHMVRPMAVLVTGEGVIYVADPGAKGVHRFDPNKKKYRLIRLQKKSPLLSPIALTLGPDNTVYVADSALNQIFTITRGAKYAEPMSLQATLEQPTGIAWNKSKDRLYVVNTKTHDIKVFGKNGDLLQSFGKRGDDRQEFNYPTFLWCNGDDSFWIVDTLNFRIQRFNGRGKALSRFGKAGNSTGHLSRPKGVATDNLKHVYVVDALFHGVQIFDTKGKLLLYFGGQGKDAGEFWLPTGIFISEDQRIFVADSHNQRIQVFRYVGGTP